MVFFPSHAFLENVYHAFENLYGKEEDLLLLMQESYMKEEEREAFLDFFLNPEDVDFEGKIQMDVLIEEEDHGENQIVSEKCDKYDAAERAAASGAKTLIGFCVMGGIFGEGIDLKNDSLIGAIIVGTGLPQVCPEREILKKHFDAMGEDGFDYAYKYPGMNKVLQAAGRVIRTAEDAGIVALLDERFMQTGYRKMFPAEWQRVTPVTIENAGIAAVNFWEELEGE